MATSRSNKTPRGPSGIKVAETLYRYDVNKAAQVLSDIALKNAKLEDIKKAMAEVAAKIKQLEQFLADPEWFGL